MIFDPLISLLVHIPAQMSLPERTSCLSSSNVALHCFLPLYDTMVPWLLASYLTPKGLWQTGWKVASSKSSLPRCHAMPLYNSPLFSVGRTCAMFLTDRMWQWWGMCLHDDITLYRLDLASNLLSLPRWHWTASYQEGSMCPLGEVHLTRDCGQRLGAEQDTQVHRLTATKRIELPNNLSKLGSWSIAIWASRWELSLDRHLNCNLSNYAAKPCPDIWTTETRR